ncbi:PREDICTED: putative F-box protein At3g52320 [Ipomoea nil]|uniref:putative F-box protein At3g52320 n=1 Tax=Ipomoea nil TaxID=35883 RepID=UPI000901E522|nr:PREDICTED: putative F-box protein At3g52320 [Ipomoea nil]
MSKEKQRRVSDASPSLPEEMVAEILSWLPVESVLRFKCACKKWGQLIQQDHFVEKHHRRAAMACYYQKEYINQFCSEFSCIDIQEGLLLEQEDHRLDPPGRFRIRNPATMQTVYLPDLQVGDESPAWVVARMFFVAKSINECKVISFWEESEGSVLSGRFRALTVGVDAEWRPLKNSPPNPIHRISNSDRKPMVFPLSIQKIFHVITMDGDHRNILMVDSEDESIKIIKIPENLFYPWRSVIPREWNSNLSFFPSHHRDGNQIEIWILMNSSNNEWVNFKTQATVDLASTLTQDYPMSYITKKHVAAWKLSGDIFWRWHESVYLPWVMKEELSIKPSILQLKGMQSGKVDA